MTDLAPHLNGRLILVRHAKTHDNLADRFCGWTDSVICEEGLAAAEQLAAHIRETDQIDYLYCSPLQRARITAGLIGLAIRREPILEAGLREINFGDIEGLSHAEFQEAHPSVFEIWERTRHDLTFAWPNGESRTDFHARVRATLNVMLGRHPGQTILAVSHGGCIAGYISHACDNGLTDWRKRNVDNCSVSELIFTDGRAKLTRFNDTSFLKPVEPAPPPSRSTAPSAG